MIYSRAKLKEVCKIGDGAHASLKRQKSGVLYLTAKNITESGINLSNVDYISEEIYNKHFSKKSNALTCPQKNDILYSIIGSIGGVYIVGDEKIGISSSVAIFRCVEEIVMSQYLYYYIKSPSFHDSIQLVKGGVAQGFMSLSKLGDIEVVYPEDINVQIKIASILSAYDDLIENNQKQIKLLEEAAMRLYKEWFVYLRFPGHENTPIKDGVPEGWERTIIDRVCNTIGGGTPSTKNRRYYEGGNIPWVTPTDITKNNCIVLLDTEKKITELGLKNSSAKLLPPDTILMTSRASVGYFGLCEMEVCTNQGFISCIPNNENYRLYLLYNLMHRTDEIRQKAGGATYLEISKTTFRGLEILFPNEIVALKFQQHIYPILNKIRVLKKMIKNSLQARDKLLPKLMSGEIEV